MFGIKNQLPDINEAHDTAAIMTKSRVEREVETILKPQIVSVTQSAIRAGFFEACLAKHNYVHPTSVQTTIDWLSDSGYTAYLQNRSCDCSSHIFWNWSTKRVQIAAPSKQGEAPKFALVPQLVETL